MGTRQCSRMVGHEGKEVHVELEWNMGMKGHVGREVYVRGEEHVSRKNHARMTH